MDNYMKTTNLINLGYQFENEFLDHLPILSHLFESQPNGIVLCGIYAADDCEDLLEKAVSNNVTLYFANEHLTVKTLEDLDRVVMYRGNWSCKERALLMGDLKYLEEVSIDFDTSFIHDTNWEAYLDPYIKYQSSKLTQVHEPYGGLPASFNEHNTIIYQRFFSKSEADYEELGRQLNMEVHTVSAIEQRPGNTIPLHIDRFYKLRQKVQDNTRQPVRANIFLEDWKDGGIFYNLKIKVITNWKKHTGFIFNEHVLHLSSNCGVQRQIYITNFRVFKLMPTRYTNLPDNKNKIYGGAYSVHDHELCAYRDLVINNFTLKNNYSVENAEKIKSNFVDTYKTWMFSTHNDRGAGQFSRGLLHKHGTTESFYQFYLRYKDSRRLRIAKGEYFFHQMMKSLWYPAARFAWLDEDDIRSDDVVLIESVPFSDSCTLPENLDDLLTRCDNLGVPVMLDFAYLNLAVGL